MNTSMANAARLLGAGFRAILVLTVLTGVLYPLLVTGVAQGLFSHQANGSEIKADGRSAGSELIGQRYDLPLKRGQKTAEPDLRWFQPRPSDGLGSNRENGVNTRYDLQVSGATNLSADNRELIRAVREAKAAVIEDNSTPGHKVRPQDVPPDAVTSSGSGLDPHISPQYARLQAHRVAERNHLSTAVVDRLIARHTDGRLLGFMGEPRVNVLQLNLALREVRAGDRG
ncbi:potassium-transporting ATPase subunit C [Streptomyces sp. ODS28]|uniref:potassium-transporting ATPase subunit C n=1 Tax=Streptomyces sp. ODS28 TaxID=3136688 RepID=UPI0031E70785